MTGEAPKPPPAADKTGTETTDKTNRALILYWSVYAALIAAAVAASVGLGVLGVPGWLATILAMAAIGVAIWFLEDSSLNPDREAGKDPLGRGFFAMNLHMIRVWMLRVRKAEWREASGLPAHAVSTFKDKLGVAPLVLTEADGFLWAAGERARTGGAKLPRFVVVAFDVTGRIRAADDLRAWPKGWTVPAGSRVAQAERS